jgi:thiol-disulfide isomerase/thioredoxin
MTMRPRCLFVATAAALIGGSLGMKAGDDNKKGGDAKVELKVVTLEELEKHVASLKGKPAAMDVWATYCVPCREKFPKFLALAAKNKDKAAFLTLSIDEEGEHDKAKEFLARKKATIPNFRSKEGAEPVEKKFKHEGVPLYILWDAAGKIALKTDEYDKLEEKLKELVAEKKAAP